MLSELSDRVVYAGVAGTGVSSIAYWTEAVAPIVPVVVGGLTAVFLVLKIARLIKHWNDPHA